jgi:streptogramin lyase
MAPSPLDYVPVPESFRLPIHANFGGTSGIAFNSKGNIFVIHRGPMPLMEFDPDGNFIRGFGDGLFDRPHGLRIDAQDNIWATDVAAHVVYKFNPGGRLEMVLGVKNRAELVQCLEAEALGSLSPDLRASIDGLRLTNE